MNDPQDWNLAITAEIQEHMSLEELAQCTCLTIVEPHRKMVQALRLSKTVCCLTLARVAMSEAGDIIRALRINQTVTHLALDNVGDSVITACLQVKPQLQSLIVRNYCPYASRLVAEEVAQCLPQLTHLQQLEFSGARDRLDSPDGWLHGFSWALSMNQTLKHLRIKTPTCLADCDVHDLAKALHNHPSLISLTLETRQSVPTAGVFAELGELLQKNLYLRTVDLVLHHFQYTINLVDDQRRAQARAKASERWKASLMTGAHPLGDPWLIRTLVQAVTDRGHLGGLRPPQ